MSLTRRGACFILAGGGGRGGRSTSSSVWACCHDDVLCVGIKPVAAVRGLLHGAVVHACACMLCTHDTLPRPTAAQHPRHDPRPPARPPAHVGRAGTYGMNYSLVSRDLIADCIETMCGLLFYNNTYN